MTIREMPSDSRVWIYQSNRELSQSEVDEISRKGESFISEWTAHRKLMEACLSVEHHRFIVLMADEKKALASGCAIDKSIYFIKEMEQRFNITLLDRTLVAFRTGEGTNTFRISEFEKFIQSGTISPETLVFNNLVTSKKEWESHWLTPLKNTWLMKNVGK